MTPILDFQACLSIPETMSSIDHKVVPVPWNEKLFCPAKKRLKIGYYTDDGYFPLTPACKRAVEVAIGMSNFSSKFTNRWLETGPKKSWKR